MTTMYGLTRGTTTLIGAGAAGLLLWLATQVSGESTSAYWATVGLIAAAGLVMALSQLIGGWTKWGLPTISPTVLLVAFLPVLIAGGLVVLHAQPDSGAFGADWADSLGVGGLAEDLAAVLPAIAFGIGLTFGLTFDTTGPRRDEDVVVQRDHVAEEPVTAERDYVAPGEPHLVETGPRRDVDEHAVVGAGAMDAPPAETPRRRGLFRRD